VSGEVRLSHLFMHVTDLQASRNFYVEWLGLEMLFEEPGYLRVGGADGFHIGMEQDPDRVGSEGTEIVVRVPNVDAACDRLIGLGVPLESSPQDMPWGARHAWLRDPSGYRLSIFSPI
jgi:catechol 2,3-dioxygenase-like lactoylglutathione lyase family enzyme